LLDENNPRSVLFQFNGILSYLRKLSLTYGPCGEEVLVPLLEELQNLDRTTQLRGDNPQLTDLLIRISNASGTVSEQIGLRFFSYTGDVQLTKMI
jgi:uncharacterized alpha-E superfamily protein